jgi:hypothetical protein
MGNYNKEKFIHVRINDKQYKILKGMAKEYNGISEFIRTRLFDSDPYYAVSSGKKKGHSTKSR